MHHIWHICNRDMALDYARILFLLNILRTNGYILTRSRLDCFFNFCLFVKELWPLTGVRMLFYLQDLGWHCYLSLKEFWPLIDIRISFPFKWIEYHQIIYAFILAITRLVIFHKYV